MTNFDFHMHSHISGDGELTPTQLITLAKEAGLEYVALSDHNDMRGIDEMIKAGKQANIQVIPAIEFDTLFNDLEVHVLGYNIDYQLPYFKNLAAQLKKISNDAMHERITKLEAYYGVTLDEKAIMSEAEAKQMNPWFVLVDKMMSDPKNQDIPDFQDYLPGGKRSVPQAVNFYWDKCSAGSPVFVPVAYPSLKETVKIIHDAGGIAILAHPWKTFYQQDALLKQALDDGIDGIEVYSNYHEDFHNTYYEEYCRKHHVLMSCGSDFHGKIKPNIKIGEYGYHKDDGKTILDAFLNALNTYK